MTCIGPQQTGKTLSWLVGLVWSFIYKPCLSLVVYESEDKAEAINAEKLRPVLQNIPPLAAELSRPKSSRVNGYSFSSLRSYFMGAGTPTTSYSAKIRVADELDKWKSHESKIANLDEVRFRARSFYESMLAKVCTVDGGAEGSAIWQEFLKSSQGYWHLRCKECGELSLRSCDIHNLQWELTDDGKIVDDSIRLICPLCKHEHTEGDKKEMNLRGDYIHARPELFDTAAGFQWGGLAAWTVDAFTWKKIAAAQMEAGKSGDYRDQLKFDNAVRGLPFMRRHSGNNETTIKKHCAPLPAPEAIKYKFLSADTQDYSFYWVVRGFDDKRNSYLLSHGKAANLEELAEAIDANAPALTIIDAGGHRAKEVQAFAYSRGGILQYKGYTQSSTLTRWDISKNDPRLVLANPKIYQAELLYSIYGRANAVEKLWLLPPEISKEYMEQLLDMHPNKRMKAGHDYRNWEGTGNDHYFDAEKMLLVAHDVYTFLINKHQKETRKCKVERTE